MPDEKALTADAENLCFDLVCSTCCEPSLRFLFASPPGQWHDIRKLFEHSAMMREDVKIDAISNDEVFVTWLDDPVSTPGYVIVIFHHYDTVWTRGARYNRRRLLSKS